MFERLGFAAWKPMQRKRIVVGLDLGEHALKCAVVETDRNAIRAAWQQETFPNRLSRDQSLAREALREKLRSFFESCKKEFPNLAHQVVTAIQSDETVCRYLEFPQLTKKELETAVPAEAQKYLTFPISQGVLSYSEIPQLTQGKKKSGVFFVATPKVLVGDLKDLFEACNLELIRLDVPPLALVRELVRNRDLSRTQLVALVHIGFRLTQVILVRQAYPYYVRSFPPASRDFTYAFQMHSQSTWPEAELQKINYNVATHEVAFEPFLQRWVNEIKKSLDFFSGQFPGEKLEIGQGYLSGGGANLKGLDRYLSEELNLNFRVDRWEHLAFEGNPEKVKEAPIYKLAVGLALEG